MLGQFFRTFEPQFPDPANLGKFIVKGGVGFWNDIHVKISKRAPVA
jgi:hypothetical protein